MYCPQLQSLLEPEIREREREHKNRTSRSLVNLPYVCMFIHCNRLTPASGYSIPRVIKRFSRNYSEFVSPKCSQKRLPNVGKMLKINTNVLEQVHMGPFGKIFAQNGSHGLWEASGTPPSPKADQKQKIGFRVLGFMAPRAPTGP